MLSRIIVKLFLYTSKSYFLWQLPYENTIQYPCKAVKALSNGGVHNYNKEQQVVSGQQLVYLYCIFIWQLPYEIVFESVQK